MGDVGLMSAQPSSGRVPLSDEADEARYRVTDQAVDALAVAWYDMCMHDVAIVCDHCISTRCCQAQGLVWVDKPTGAVVQERDHGSRAALRRQDESRHAVADSPHLPLPSSRFPRSTGKS